MPQSSARLKQHQAQPQQQVSAREAAPEPERPSARTRAKRFPVARAESIAAAEAKRLAPSVERSDADIAAAAAREGAADSARRRLERRRAGVGRAGGQADPAARSREDVQDGGQGAGADAKMARKFHLSWPVIVVCVLLALVLAMVAVFSWDRWLRFDDASDFQGTWYANGTASTVSIDGEKMQLTDDVAYSYSLDTGAKTISFSFGTYEGQGRYRFSADRSELVITDGSDFSFWGNLLDDVSWRFGQAIDNLQGKEIAREAAVDGVTVLDRTKTQS